MAEHSIHNISYGGNTYNFEAIWYGECDTAAATAAKTVTITGFPSTLVAGTAAAIKFANSNSVASPTLSINSGTAHSIIRYGTSAPSTSVASSWAAGAVVLMIYDGTYWRICSYKDNTTYSEISVANITNLTGSSSGLVSGRRFKSAFDTNTENGAAATTNYDKANIKNIIESDSAPGSTTAPNGTVWLQYGNTWVDEAADYVVEHGTSGHWTYEKWNSGVCKAWYYESFNYQPSFTQQATGIYSHSDWTSRTINLPSGLFSTVTGAHANIITNSYVHIGVPAYSTVAVAVRVWMDLATSPKLQGLNIEVVGTWK